MIIGAVALAALVVALLSFQRDAVFPTNNNSMTKTFNELVALKNEKPPFNILRVSPWGDPSSVIYEENGTRTTKAPVYVVVEKQPYLVDTNEFRLYISPEADGATYRLNVDRQYFGRIAEEQINVPPGAESRSRFVLMISDKPFEENGDPVVKPTPRTRTIR